MIHTMRPGVAKLGKRHVQDSDCGIKEVISSSNYKIYSKSAPMYIMTLCSIHESPRTNI